MNRRSFVRRLLAAVCAAPLAMKLPALVPVAPPVTPFGSTLFNPAADLASAYRASEFPARMDMLYGYGALGPARGVRVGDTVNVRLPQRYAVTAGKSSPVARMAHNHEAAGSNPAPATTSRPPALPASSCVPSWLRATPAVEVTHHLGVAHAV